MPLRPDLPSGLNLSRRATTPVKLPKMNFPMLGGVPESAPGHAEPAQQQLPAAPVQGYAQIPEEVKPMPMMPAMPPQHQAQPYGAPAPAPAAPAKEASRVLVYGALGCAAAMDAIQDLINRGVSFTYYDVSRDAQAAAHLQAIVGQGNMVVPVIIHIGYGAV